MYNSDTFLNAQLDSYQKNLEQIDDFYDKNDEVCICCGSWKPEYSYCNDCEDRKDREYEESINENE